MPIRRRALFSPQGPTFPSLWSSRFRLRLCTIIPVLSGPTSSVLSSPAVLDLATKGVVFNPTTRERSVVGSHKHDQSGARNLC